MPSWILVYFSGFWSAFCFNLQTCGWKISISNFDLEYRVVSDTRWTSTHIRWGQKLSTAICWALMHASFKAPNKHVGTHLSPHFTDEETGQSGLSNLPWVTVSKQQCGDLDQPLSDSQRLPPHMGQKNDAPSSGPVAWNTTKEIMAPELNKTHYGPNTTSLACIRESGCSCGLFFP